MRGSIDGPYVVYGSPGSGSVPVEAALTLIGAPYEVIGETVLCDVSGSATTAYLSVILLRCRSFASLAYAGVLIPLVRWASPRLQLRLACVLVTLALSYPLLRVADLIPTNTIVNDVAVLSTSRAGSLQTRFDNEEQLLDRAWERPWFGWGRYGRNRVYRGWNGADSTLSDGHWILQMGSFGLVGFVAEFDLLALCVFRAAMALTTWRRSAELASTQNKIPVA